MAEYMVAAAGSEDVSTVARAFAKQASIDRSRAAIQGLNDAAEVLRSQTDLLASYQDDSGDEAIPTPEMQKTAVQRFLSRRLSRQVSRRGSNCSAPPCAEAPPTGGDGAATISDADNRNHLGGGQSNGGLAQTAAETGVTDAGDVDAMQQGQSPPGPAPDAQGVAAL